METRFYTHVRELRARTSFPYRAFMSENPKRVRGTCGQSIYNMICSYRSLGETNCPDRQDNATTCRNQEVISRNGPGTSRNRRRVLGFEIITTNRFLAPCVVMGLHLAESVHRRCFCGKRQRPPAGLAKCLGLTGKLTTTSDIGFQAYLSAQA